MWKSLSLLKVIALGPYWNVIAFYRYHSESMTKAITCNAVTFWSNIADLCPCPLFTAYCFLSTVFLSTAHCPLPHPLPTVCCPLPTVCCSLPTVYCPLLAVHCPMFTAHWPLFAAHCLLFNVHYPLSSVHYPLFAARHLLPSVCCPLPSITAQCPQHSWNLCLLGANLKYFLQAVALLKS